MDDAAEKARVAHQLRRRRASAAEEWNLTDELVLIGAGQPIPVPGRGDLTYPFQAHSEYFYLTDRNQPGGVLAFDPYDGWVDFRAPVSAAERLWLGAHDDQGMGPTTAELEEWVAARAPRPVACLGAASPGTSCDGALTCELRFGLDRVRRPKDEVELERMRRAERATRAAFAVLVPMLRDGTTERAAQIEMEAEAFRRGADRMAYDTIVASGPNAAALHFAPTERPMRDGELVLIDAGAEHHGYASDITRTYPVGGEFTAEQRELHSLIRTAELAAIAHCTTGTEWRDVHLLAAQIIAEGLRDCGILRGQPDSLIEAGTVWLFFPHGVGHLVGLGVRDAGGPLADRRDAPPPFPNLRIDLPLEPGMVVTVEPGVYFVRALLEDPEQRARHRRGVAWERVDRMLDFGGIRIEDNVLVGERGPEVMTRDVPLLG